MTGIDMSKVRVQFVKYDMTKTKNRNRKDMLVDGQSESAVIAQLERIHKGEEVVKIHEIVWDEKQIKETVRQASIDQRHTFYGKIKFFDIEKGFGFILPDEDMEDLFFHLSAFSGGAPFEKDRVEFKISEGPKGLCAIQVKVVEEE
jgi:CspA family cold shock protein